VSGRRQAGPARRHECSCTDEYQSPLIFCMGKDQLLTVSVKVGIVFALKRSSVNHLYWNLFWLQVGIVCASAPRGTLWMVAPCSPST
jgi:hypothetical protein